jgi:hypothetical protein
MAVTSTASDDEDVQREVLTELKFDPEVGQTEITVRPSDTPTPDYVKDRIVSALLRNAELDARKITVTTDGGKVTLTGTVYTWVEVEEAERVAWSAPGVTEVDNRIVVRH